MAGFNFVCPICKNTYKKIQGFRSRDIENFSYYGLIPLKTGDSGKFEADESTVFPIVALVCNHCGHLALFQAKLFEELLQSGK